MPTIREDMTRAAGIPVALVSAFNSRAGALLLLPGGGDLVAQFE